MLQILARKIQFYVFVYPADQPGRSGMLLPRSTLTSICIKIVVVWLIVKIDFLKINVVFGFIKTNVGFLSKLKPQSVSVFFHDVAHSHYSHLRPYSLSPPSLFLFVSLSLPLPLIAVTVAHCHRLLVSSF